MSQVNSFILGPTKVILEDFDLGKGNIIITQDGDAWTYFWSAMGSSIADFLIGTNAPYFVNKLCRNQNEFNAKKSVTKLRKAIRDAFPFYYRMEEQKELRKLLKSIETAETDRDFVSMTEALPNTFIDPFYTELQNLFTESWYYLDTSFTKEYQILTNIHKRIVKYLKK